MEPLSTSALTVLSASATGDVTGLAEVGVISIIALLLLFALVQAGLSVFQTRALNNQINQGIQAIVGVNNMTTIDRAMEDQKQAPPRREERRPPRRVERPPPRREDPPERDREPEGNTDEQ